MESDSQTLNLIIILVCLIISAFFSASETAFSCLNKIKIKNLAQKGNKKAKKVLDIYEKYDNLLSTILIGNNIVNILSASIATIIFVSWIGESKGPTISTIITTIVVLIFGEISPKTIAKEMPEKIAMLFAPILNILMSLFTPFNYLFSLWKKILAKLFKSKDDDGITEEELLTIVEEAAEDGNINKDEKDLIQNAIEFNELEVSDILTPRMDITAISKDFSKEEIERIFKETAYSRLPVYNESIDHIIGVLNYKDFYKDINKKIENNLQTAVFVTKNKKISSLLKEMQTQKAHIAVVINEYGETIGIVTLEDIIEELVGEIWDEHDEVSIDINKIDEDEYIVSGYTNIEKINELFDKNIKFSEEFNIKTVSGWIMELLERIPKEKDIVKYDGLILEVLSMRDKRIDKVKISRRK